MRFHGDGFLCIVSHDIFEDFLLTQDIPVLCVAEEPEPRGLVVEVVSDRQVVGPHLMHRFFVLIYYDVFVSCEYVVYLVALLVLLHGIDVNLDRVSLL